MLGNSFRREMMFYQSDLRKDTLVNKLGKNETISRIIDLAESLHTYTTELKAAYFELTPRESKDPHFCNSLQNACINFEDIKFISYHQITGQGTGFFRRFFPKDILKDVVEYSENQYAEFVDNHIVPFSIVDNYPTIKLKSEGSYVQYLNKDAPTLESLASSASELADRFCMLYFFSGNKSKIIHWYLAPVKSSGGFMDDTGMMESDVDDMQTTGRIRRYHGETRLEITDINNLAKLMENQARNLEYEFKNHALLVYRYTGRDEHDLDVLIEDIFENLIVNGPGFDFKSFTYTHLSKDFNSN